MAVTLQTHINQINRLLHDSQSTYLGTTDDPNEKIDYINQARRRVAADTACLRQLKTVSLTINVEKFAFPTITGSDGTLDVLCIYVLSGNTRTPLGWRNFTDFTINWRPTTSRKGKPIVFSIYQQEIYVAPIPNQTYSSEWDVLYIPTDLTGLTNPETIPYPYSDLVPYYAAHLAYYKDKAYEESRELLQKYKDLRIEVMGSVYQVKRLLFSDG